MLKFLQPTYVPVFGIDLRPSSVTLVEVTRTGSSFYFKKPVCEMLPVGALDGTAVHDSSAVISSLKKLSKQITHSGRKAAVAIPDTVVLSKRVQIPHVFDDALIEELVAVETDKFIPYPIEEINLDFVIQGPSKVDPLLLDVLIIVTKAAAVNERVEVLRRAGFEVLYVDVESFAILRALEVMQQHTTAILPEKLDIKADWRFFDETTLAILVATGLALKGEI